MASEAIKRHLTDHSRAELSRPALECLAMIAYRGPMTAGALEKMRGVSSDAMIRSLLAKDLITEAGKALQEGRPTQYVVSHRFLSHMGLASLDELPPLGEDEDAA